MSYSEKELADKAQIERDTGIDGVLIEDMRTRFLNSELMEDGSISVVKPPERCNEGKRRNFLDYIDYLFPDPPVETLIEQSVINEDVFVVSVQVTENAIFVRYRRKEVTDSML